MYNEHEKVKTLPLYVATKGQFTPRETTAKRMLSRKRSTFIMNCSVHVQNQKSEIKASADFPFAFSFAVTFLQCGFAIYMRLLLNSIKFCTVGFRNQWILLTFFKNDFRRIQFHMNHDKVFKCDFYQACSIQQEIYSQMKMQKWNFYRPHPKDGGRYCFQFVCQSRL